mmetsp:Transcript_134843/g.430937  ORF Transcript_134843/g.430937 Transcript_134843/m.430937 type:complete len:282 (+) Transcript_134843:361-1206(+)
MDVCTEASIRPLLVHALEVEPHGIVPICAHQLLIFVVLCALDAAAQRVPLHHVQDRLWKDLVVEDRQHQPFVVVASAYQGSRQLRVGRSEPERTAHSNPMEDVLFEHRLHRHLCCLCRHRTGDLQVQGVVAPRGVRLGGPWALVVDLPCAPLRLHPERIQACDACISVIVAHHSAHEAKKVREPHATPEICRVCRPPIEDVAGQSVERDESVVDHATYCHHSGELTRRCHEHSRLHRRPALRVRVPAARRVPGRERRIRQKLEGIDRGAHCRPILLRAGNR